MATQMPAYNKTKQLTFIGGQDHELAAASPRKNPRFRLRINSGIIACDNYLDGDHSLETPNTAYMSTKKTLLLK